MLLQASFDHDAMHQPANANDVLMDAAIKARPAALSLYDEGATIYAQGDKAGPLFLVEFGSVRLCRMTAEGRRQISAFVLPGEVFGFEASGNHAFQAETVDCTGLRLLPPACDAQSARDTLTLALRGLMQAQEHLLVLGRQSAVERVASFLLDLATRQNDDQTVYLPMQRADIADYLGLTFETVSRTIGKLRDMNLIRLASVREIRLLDIEGLKTLCA